MSELDRSTIKIQPVYIGIHHYNEVYGSVCSADVEGTPPIDAPAPEDLRKSARAMIERFKDGTDVEFVQIEDPYLIKEHRDLRQLASELTYDVDALLVGSIGSRPWEQFTLSQYGLPIITGPVSGDFLGALRVKRFLHQSKFLYVGEIPSFSAPGGPYDFLEVEKRLGVRVRHIETNEFYRYFDSFPEEEVSAELENWRKDFEEVIEPDEKSLLDATRVYLALRSLCQREDANGVTVNCGRFTEERPVVPCLAFDRLIDEGIMCGCEGDITAILSSLMLHAASGQAVTMGNFGYRLGAFGAKEGEVTIEHDLIPLSMAAKGYTIRDYHGRKFGVTGYTDIKAGEPMTLLNLDKSLDRIVVIQGQTKSSEDGIHCRVIVHMSVEGDVKGLSDALVGSQHMSMCFGHWLAALDEVGKLLGFEVHHL